ncbi:MAG: hypothetical protein OXR82_02430 [Gammaproteobacteria bacterium]|nr:hypothetical protein [Gammaproteobacteria bacterium]MDE0257232.1 hypothetical protein [Gammaproteobacteria bacterium]
MSDTSEHAADGQALPGRTSLVRSIVVAAVVGFGVVSFWRGVWYLWDVFTLGQEDRMESALASMITGIVILAVMRTFYSALAPPIERVNIR